MTGSTDEIEKLLSANEANINWRYAGPSDKTKLIVNADNLLHLAARTANSDKFLSTFKKSIEKDAYLLEYNENRENPFHIAARMGILPSVVEGIFEHLKSEKTELEYNSTKLEEIKNYVQEALRSRCALDKSKKTPLDWVSKTVRKKIKETAGITDSIICNKKFHLCLYIIGAMVCIAALCLSLYFLYLSCESLALASMATIASGGVAYLLGKVCSEVHDSHDVSTLMDNISNEGLARVNDTVYQ